MTTRAEGDTVRRDVVIYASGLVCSSVCAPADVTREDVERSVNFQSPTGISSQWAVADEPFANGDPNPRPCEQDPTRLHWLLQC